MESCDMTLQFLAGRSWHLRDRRLSGFFRDRARLCRAEQQKQSAPKRRLPPEERKNQTQHDANDDAGDDREIERVVAALNADIARQTSEPTGANATPKQKAEHNGHGSEDDEKFSECRHGRIWHRNLGVRNNGYRHFEKTAPKFTVAAVYDRPFGYDFKVTARDLSAFVRDDR
jgi:hypothetical protein